MTHTILRIDASARREGSISRDLVDQIIARFGEDTAVISRDLAGGMDLIDEAWVGANFTPADARTMLDTTRKWIIPLLEALDKSGFTRRDGQQRVLKG